MPTTNKGHVKINLDGSAAHAHAQQYDGRAKASLPRNQTSVQRLKRGCTRRRDVEMRMHKSKSGRKQRET